MSFRLCALVAILVLKPILATASPLGDVVISRSYSTAAEVQWQSTASMLTDLEADALKPQPNEPFETSAIRSVFLLVKNLGYSFYETEAESESKFFQEILLSELQLDAVAESISITQSISENTKRPWALIVRSFDLENRLIGEVQLFESSMNQITAKIPSVDIQDAN